MVHQVVDNQCVYEQDEYSRHDRHKDKFKSCIPHNPDQCSGSPGRMQSMSDVHTEDGEPYCKPDCKKSGSQKLHNDDCNDCRNQMSPDQISRLSES